MGRAWRALRDLAELQRWKRTEAATAAYVDALKAEQAAAVAEANLTLTLTPTPTLTLTLTCAKGDGFEGRGGGCAPWGGGSMGRSCSRKSSSMG